MIIVLLLCVGALFALGLAAVPLAATPAGRPVIYGGALGVTSIAGLIALAAIGATPSGLTLPLGLPWLGAHFRLDALAGVLPAGGRSRRRRRQPVCAGLRPARGGTAPRPAVLPGVSWRDEPGRAGGRRLQLPAVVGADVARVLGAGGLAAPRRRQPARRLHLHRDGELRHAGAVAGLRAAGGRGRRLRLRHDARRASVARAGRHGAGAGADRRRVEGRAGAAACLAAAGASRRRRATSPR